MTTRLVALAACAAALASCGRDAEPRSAWSLSPGSPVALDDAAQLRRIERALDAARESGTDPGISGFQVRAATVVEAGGEEHVVVGGNSEYAVPEAVHGEVSVVNHVIARLGAPAARGVKFIAFYSQTCGDSRGCGDCRDYMRAATAYADLLWVCGQASDRTIHVRKFADGLLDEELVPEATPDRIDVPAADFARLVAAARSARAGGVTLFTGSEQHAGAAVLTWGGRIYKAAGADDAAFHYRYPVGGALQQAATERDYFVRAVLVEGAKGRWPRVMYRDRQYGLEASSFGTLRGYAPALLVLGNGEGRFRATTFEAALPHPFSAARFNPEAIERFLARQVPPAASH